MKVDLNKVSNYLMGIGIIVGIYGFYEIYTSRIGLPPGACPIENNRPIMYVAITFLVSSVITGFIDDIRKKKRV